jgi:5S rRNA maturation endonuclease (ribonuclease M5)
MNPVEKVLEAVDYYEARANGFWCLCPAHDDHDPSLHVEEAEDGSALFKCRAGCDQADVLAALETRGLKKCDLFPKASLPNETSSMNGHSKGARSASSGRGRLAASYHVKDASGCLVAVHERWEGSSGKRFLWRHPNGGYSRKGEIRPASLPLYGSEAAANWPEDSAIILVEGEKPADALRSVGLRRALGTVTGANGTHEAEALEILAGRRVILWPDNDAPGRTHMHRHAERLQGIASAVHWYEWEAALEKDDAADHPAVMSGDRTGLEELANELKAAPAYKPDDEVSVGLSGPSSEGSSPREDESDERKPTQSELLVRCAAGVELFHTPVGDAYATLSVGDHRETHPIKSKGFRRWLVRGYFESHDRPPGVQAMQDALGLLEARAQFDGVERDVHVRVAEHDGAIYVDLANERWEAVEITAEGWRVVSDSPVRFRRPRGLLPLPTPARGGSVGELRRFVNVADETSWRLMVAWVVQALRPGYPYPLLILQGEQGSAKSTAERLLAALVDPSVAPLRTTPRNEHDLYIAAENGHVVAFDNISDLKPWLSDALCRLSTGGGFGTRTLYENREQELFEGMRPVILNGITEVAARADLLDRALIVTLPHIREEHRKVEAKLWRDFERARPTILGALFDAISGALAAITSLRLEGLPRMADFALWATAAEGALGWDEGTFMAAYVGNREEATETALEADPVAGAVREFMRERDEWRGTAGELWKVLNELVDEGIRHTRAWPGAPNALSSRLKRLAPALRGIGIEYGEDRDKAARKKTLTKKRRAEDRHHRHHRHPEEKHPQKGGFAGDGPDGEVTMGDDPDKKIVTPKFC